MIRPQVAELPAAPAGAPMNGAQLSAAASVEAALVTRRMARLRRIRRAPLVAIDRIVDALELRHLAGSTRLDDRVWHELERLSRLVPLTREVIAAVDTRQLHAALLDLQEDVLDAVVPSRHECIWQDEVDTARDSRARSSRPLRPSRCEPWAQPGSIGSSQPGGFGQPCRVEVVMSVPRRTRP